MPREKARKRKPTGLEEFSEIESSLQNNWLLNFRIKKPFHFNENHKQFYDCLKQDNTNMVFMDGPAGTAKTYIAVLAALELIKEQKTKGITYIRSVIESASRSIGALPGEVDDKFLPYAMPLIEKVKEVTEDSTCAMLQAHNIIHAVPVNFVRGLTFNDSVVIVDEAQNLTYGELGELHRTPRRSDGQSRLCRPVLPDAIQRWRDDRRARQALSGGHGRVRPCGRHDRRGAHRRAAGRAPRDRFRHGRHHRQVFADRGWRTQGVAGVLRGRLCARLPAAGAHH